MFEKIFELYFKFRNSFARSQPQLPLFSYKDFDNPAAADQWQSSTKIIQYRYSGNPSHVLLFDADEHLYNRHLPSLLPCPELCPSELQHL